MKYLPLWASIYWNMLGYQNRPNNANVENWFNILKNHLLRDKNEKIERVVEFLEGKTLLLQEAAECAPHLKTNTKTIKKRISKIQPLETPKTTRSDERLPHDIHTLEEWKRPTTSRVPNYSGKSALRNYLKSKKVNFNANISEYIL